MSSRWRPIFCYCQCVLSTDLRWGLCVCEIDEVLCIPHNIIANIRLRLGVYLCTYHCRRTWSIGFLAIYVLGRVLVDWTVFSLQKIANPIWQHAMRSIESNSLLPEIKHAVILYNGISHNLKWDLLVVCFIRNVFETTNLPIIPKV